MTEVALALGGGGVKGIAHLGVIQRLEKEGIKIKAIAGTSAGGVVGALFAAGYSVSQLSDALEELNRINYFVRRPQDGPSLLGLGQVVPFLERFLAGLTFDRLLIPFACTAVDLHTKQEYVLNRGSVLDAILATIAIPGIFPPQKIGQAELVDGGVLDPVPVAVARWLAPKLPVIAVCLSPVPEKWQELPDFNPIPTPPILPPLLSQISNLRISQAFRIYIQSIDITSRMLAELRMQVEKPDVILRPDVNQFGILDKVDPQVLIQSGEQSVEEALEAIHHALSWPQGLLRRFQSPPPPESIRPLEE
ncbi:patatin-like phospholipase family protein [Thermanaerothrix daxensis]|uniref:patatin-like phospholipase family protein n=1 Tax=Thermanaerothrix daxensis TaxID=869279 RepID=UPI0006C90A35|nr:patatin-like phospholipase family protein [Thermanaerothrix daxensis]